MKQKIILGSSSPSRRDIMNKLGLPYEIAHPELDETPYPNETAPLLVRRLSLAKAMAVGKQYPHALIIGCDQVAELDNIILGKPLTVENAVQQLKAQQGREIVYYSGLCLLNTATGKHHITVDETRVKFRPLGDAEIRRYIALDNPLHCAASFKCESRGMLIVEWVHGDDVHGLMGLSLISLSRLLKSEGVDL